MKKFLTFFLVLGLLLVPAASVLAVPLRVGTYTLDGFTSPGGLLNTSIKLSNGWWDETYSTDGPGQPGGTLAASDGLPPLGVQWSILGSQTDAASENLANPNSSIYKEYVSHYDITLTLSSYDTFGGDPLLGDFLPSFPMTATNTSHHYLVDDGDRKAGDLSFVLVSDPGVFSGYTYSLRAEWAGPYLPSWFGEDGHSNYDYFDMIPVVESYPFGSITLEISGGPAPVPEPATMLLLGSGLVGLAGMRRKFRKA